MLLIALALLAGGCATTRDEGAGEVPSVVASAYPLAEAASRVGGHLVVVENLTPAGAEPHDLELAPDDLEALVSADLVLYVGGGFQPSVEEAVADAQGRAVDVLSAVPDPLPAEGAGTDPHVWLDPIRYAAIVEEVAGILMEAEPDGADVFRGNADAFVRELQALDAEYRDGLRSCASRTLVVTHAAFGYLAEAYGLEEHSISGLTPESEPDPARLAELKALVERQGVTTIFTESLASPEIAETLAREAGVTTAVLDPLEGLTASQLDAGDDYGSIMRRNLSTLRRALGCG